MLVSVLRSIARFWRARKICCIHIQDNLGLKKQTWNIKLQAANRRVVYDKYTGYLAE